MNARVVWNTCRKWVSWAWIGALVSSSSVHAGGTILIAAEDDWPPYSSSVPGSRLPHGFAVDLVREAFASQEVHAQFIVVPFTRCLHLAKTGEVAGCFNASITSDNRDTYIWHDTPLLHEELAIFARAGGKRQDLKLSDLDDRSVGYTLGYNYPPEFLSSKTIRKVGAKSDRVLLEMLRAGRVEYVLMNTAPAFLRIDAASDLKGRIEKVGVISQDGFWIAFSRARADSEANAALFDKGLKALKSSGRYELMHAELRRRLGH